MKKKISFSIDILLLCIVLFLASFYIVERFNLFSSYSSINDFEYLMYEDELVILFYKGDSKQVNIAPSYTVQGKEYKVVEIGDHAFSNNTLVLEVILPDTIEKIGRNAFYGCSFSEITIPENVVYIGDGAFANCYLLETINFNAINCDDINSRCNVFENVGENTKLVVNIGKGVETIPAYLFASVKQSQNIIISEINISDGLKHINNNAFENADISEIVIPSSVVFIGNAAFKNSFIENISLSSNLSFISDYTFYGCSNLKQITIPKNVEIIGVRAFFNSSIISVSLPSSLKVINDYAFEETSTQIIHFGGTKEDWSGMNIVYNNFSKIKIVCSDGVI